VLARLFLALNGCRLAFGAEEAIQVVLALASGDLEEDALAGWIRSRLDPPSPADSRPAGLL